MTLKAFPSLDQLLADTDQPLAQLTEALLPAICQILQTDRCFLQVRHPTRRLYQIFCWQRPGFPDLTTDGWQPEEPWEEEDPMFAAALRAAPSIFVEDVDSAGPETLNRDFERQNMGHRALIHGHICQDGLLWGILQPCVFGSARRWSESDRRFVLEMIECIKPRVVSYGQSALA